MSMPLLSSDVPTLTEVVEPGWVPAWPDATPAVLPGDMTASVLQRAQALLEPELRAGLDQLLAQQVQLLTPRLHDLLQSVVRQAVSQALDQELEARTAVEPGAGQVRPHR